MAYDIKSKFKASSPLPCWSTHVQKGYKKKGNRTVPNCVPKSSSNKMKSPLEEYVSDAQRKAVWASKADGGAGNPNKMKSPIEKQKGGGTRKTCLPKAKVDAMSESKRKSLASAKSKAGSKGEYKRPASTNVKGARKKGSTLRDWFEKENWVQVGNPSKKCGEA
jgi:hypothetical protein